MLGGLHEGKCLPAPEESPRDGERLHGGDRTREEATMTLAPILRALVLMLALCCAAASARADDRGVEEAGVSAGRGAMPALAESQALERAAAPFETLTTGLRRRLKLRLRFDWIRSYTALGPHLYLASSIPTRALRQRTRA